jgi:hypothetical protein
MKQNSRGIDTNLSQKSEYRCSLRKLNPPVFTEKTYAQTIVHNYSKTFLGMIRDAKIKYLSL